MFKCRKLNFDTNDFDQYSILFQSLFSGAMMPKDTLRWYFTQVFGGNEVRTYGMFDKESLIGIWSVEPRALLTFDGAYQKVGRAFATAIHPDYRRQGLFVELSKFAIEQEKVLSEYAYILGFPQVKRIVIEGHVKAGWEFVQRIPAYVLFNEGISREEANQAPNAEIVSEFTSQNVFPTVGTFADTCNTLNCKWLHNPSRSYNVFTSPGYRGYVVCKVYGSVCHILDICGNIPKMLALIKRLCKFHMWTVVTTWCADNDKGYLPYVEEAGFEKTDKVIPSVELLAVKISATTPLVLESTHLQMGVEEMY